MDPSQSPTLLGSCRPTQFSSSAKSAHANGPMYRTRPITTRPVLVITLAKCPSFRHFGDFGKNGNDCLDGLQSIHDYKKKNISFPDESKIYPNSKLPRLISFSENRRFPPPLLMLLIDFRCVSSSPFSEFRKKSSASSSRLSVEPLYWP